MSSSPIEGRICADGWACLAPDCPCPDKPERPPASDAEKKLNKLHRDYGKLAQWAGEQNAGNAFAEQVKLWALCRLDEWSLPVEEWEP